MDRKSISDTCYFLGGSLCDPFFTSFFTQKKNRVRIAEEGHDITLECIFMYLCLELYIQNFF
jgi:hypothetical protein